MRIARAWRGLAAACAVALALAGCGGKSNVNQSQAAGGGGSGQSKTLNMIVWEGYTDASFVKPFEQQSGCTVKATYAGSSDEMFQKFQQSGSFDMTSPSGDASLRFINAGLVQPVDPSKVAGWKDFFPAFQSPPNNTVGGVHYGISHMWGADPLIYDTRAFPTAPDSWSVIYDPKYKGKITIPDNPIQIADVALALGIATDNPYNLSDAQLDQVKAKLKQQRPLVRKYWTSAGEFEELFKSKAAVVGAGWPLMVVDLSKASFPVGSVIPKEGATGWADTWMISKSTKALDCAYKWLDYITTPAAQKATIDVTGYSSPSKAVVPLLTADQVKQLHMDDVSYSQQLKLWQTPPNYDKWVQVWNEAKG